MKHMAEVESIKEAAWQRQLKEDALAAEEFFRAAEEELRRGGGHLSASEVSATSAAGSSSVGEGWPSELSFEFYTPDALLGGSWSGERHGECAGEASSCVYVVTIPCTAAVGPGTLRAGGSWLFAGPELPHSLHVVFNPFDERDEVYMDPALFSDDERHTYLTQSTAGIWRGSATQNGPMQWMVDQFEPSVLEAVMKLTSMIPLTQRGSAVRVARWLTYLMNNKVLRGNWCSEPGCMDDGKKPWEWTRSRDIFAQWLESGTVVKYGQCWVFAAILNSALRTLGMGSRVVTNFNSAHGRPPYERLRIWNFHVWNDVWMARRDLPGMDADGWQAVDATPQENSCEERGNETLCRFMMGPAPLKVIRDRRMETRGGETPYRSVDAGMSYDSMFVFGEVDGDYRGWKPASLDWRACPATSTASRPTASATPSATRKSATSTWAIAVRSRARVLYRACASTGSIAAGTTASNAKARRRVGLRYNNTHHIGTTLSTQSPGELWSRREDVTLVDYKKSQ